MVALGSPDPAKVRIVIADVTKRFDAYSDVVEDGLAGFAEDMQGLAEDSIGLIRVSTDFPVDQEGASITKEALIELLQNMSSTIDSMSEFASSVTSLQRMTVAFNQAKKRVVLNTMRMVEVMQSTSPIIEEAIRLI